MSFGVRKRVCIQLGNRFYHTPSSAAEAVSFCWCFGRTKYVYRSRKWNEQQARLKRRLIKVFTGWLS